MGACAGRLRTALGADAVQALMAEGAALDLDEIPHEIRASLQAGGDRPGTVPGSAPSPGSG